MEGGAPVEDAVRNSARLSAVQRTALLDTPGDAAFDRLAALAARALDVPVALISVVEADEQFLKSCVASIGTWPDDRRLPLTASYCRHVVAGGERFVVDDARVDDRLSGDPATGAVDVVAYLGAPLRTADGYTVGVLSALDSRPRKWTDVDVETVEDLAAVVSDHIELLMLRAQSLDGAVAAERDQRKTVEALLAFAEQLGLATGPGDVVRTITEHLGAVVGAVDAVLAVLDDDEHLEVRREAGGDDEQDGQTVALDAAAPFGQALHERRAVWLSDAGDIAAMFPPAAVGTVAGGYRAAVAVPVDDRSVLGLAFDHPVADTSGHRSALATAAQISAQALERVRLHQRELVIADRLQQGLLSVSQPEIPGLDIAVHYAPGRTGARVGGDWFEVVQLTGERHLVALGDIVGHGLAAAAAMGLARHAFSAVAALSATADDVVRRLDKVATDMGEMRYSTLSLLEVGTGPGPARAVSAGHPPALIRRSDGTVERCGPPGPPLGFDGGGPRRSEELRLEAGDVAVLYTDGLVERRDETIEAGIGRLAAALAGIDGRSPAGEVCAAVLEAIESPGDDDVALVVVAVRDRPVPTRDGSAGPVG